MQHLKQGLPGFALNDGRYQQADSYFGLAPAGFGCWSSRIWDSVVHLTVPVIVADGIVEPFERFLDYTSFSAKLLTPRAEPPSMELLKALERQATTLRACMARPTCEELQTTDVRPPPRGISPSRGRPPNGFAGAAVLSFARASPRAVLCVRGALRPCPTQGQLARRCVGRWCAARPAGRAAHEQLRRLLRGVQ